MNEISVDGIEWGSCVLFGARPGVGKSLMKSQLVREAFNLNADQRFRNLAFEWEMPLLMENIRELAAYLNRSYQYMCSVKDGEEQLTDEEIIRCRDYFKSRVKKKDDVWDSRIDVVNIPLEVDEFENTCIAYADAYPEDNILVTVDHIRLGKRKDFQSEQDMLYAYSAAVIRLKKMERKNKFIFIVLTHLRRDMDDPGRCKPGDVGNYVTDSDIQGGDAFTQASDIIMALDAPFQRHISRYGTYKYIIEDERILVVSYLKVRNGSKCVKFMRGLYESMQIVEARQPPKEEKIKLPKVNNTSKEIKKSNLFD